MEPPGSLRDVPWEAPWDGPGDEAASLSWKLGPESVRKLGRAPCSQTTCGAEAASLSWKLRAERAHEVERGA